MPADDVVVNEIVDFDGDPDEVVRRRLTPKALEKLEKALDSDNPNVVDRAIAKVLEIDKRLRKEAPPSNTNILIPFDAEHLKTIGEGLKAMFGGSTSARRVPKKRLAADATPSVDS